MKPFKSCLFLTNFLLTLGTINAWKTLAQAQLMPDTTLGKESSIVTPNVNVNNLGTDRIDGGAIRGANLFHSFREFNVGEGRGTYFTNPVGIENILTRVTGGNPSHILGTLGVLGKANLFILNPRGIIFGPNARLDVGGSFLASTASSFLWEPSGEFSAIDPQAPPLLAINIPIGLRFRDNPGTLVNQSRVQIDLQTSAVSGGLRVASGNSLALLGGNVYLQNGYLEAPDGQIQLGGLAAEGIVGIRNGSFIFPQGGKRADLVMGEFSNLNVAASGTGRIAIAARNFQMAPSSSLNAGILPGFSLTQGIPGTIEIDATDRVTMNGSRVETDVKTGGLGDAGSIQVRAGSLDLAGGAVLLSGVRKSEPIATSRPGKGGNIAIEVRDRVSLSGQNTAILANIGGGVIGNSGKIRITIANGSLSLTDGALLQTGTSGQGNAGKITLVVKDSVSLTGNSRITADVDSGAIGNGGNIAIAAHSLSLRDRSALVTVVNKADQTRTAGQGNAGNVILQLQDDLVLDRGSIFTTVGAGVVGNSGNIDIVANSLSLTNAAQITSATSGQPRFVTNAMGETEIQRSIAGNIVLQARENILLDGPETSVAATVTERSQGGFGGNIQIAANVVSIRNQAELTVSSQTQPDRIESLRNNAGRINVNADSIRLHRGAIQADTQAGKRASIDLNASDVQLRRNSNITTNADNTNGGDISIQADALVGLENGDITANARNGAGGAIAIQVQGIFGSQAQTRQTVETLLTNEQLQTPQFSQLLPTSDIIAISQTDPTLSGTVSVITPDVNPAAGLVQLPQTVVDPAALIGQNPCELGRNSEFTITGRGGLPPNPGEFLKSDETRVPLVDPTLQDRKSQNPSTYLPSQTVQNRPIDFAKVPAVGWIRNDKGEVILVGDRSISDTFRRPIDPTSCSTR